MQVDTRVDVFEEIFLVFLGLGTLVGVIVVAYTMYNAYKYRDDGTRDADDLPTLGELPTGGGSGKKLFVSFFLSAIVVISLIVWTYGMLLYVEDGPDELDEDAIEIDVEAAAFFFAYEYDNGIEQGPSDPLVVPAGEPVAVSVTSSDVWHTFGITQERVKADAIPGEVDETWFAAEDPGEYEDAVECFELCGAGHSSMQDDLHVLEDMDAYDAWVAEQLTLNISVMAEEEVEAEDDEDETEIEEVPYDGGFTLELEYADDADVYSNTFTEEDVEDESVTVEDIEQGGTYDVVITPDDDAYETQETSISHTGSDGGVEETITLELEEEDDDENDEEGEN
ncbi:cytochrome c oxidase subunit II [Halobacteria archaeon AArc-dxtr1]|nr:cytochrome c oxidase subunit II [Halobacteria archaeon AArc-dxtr1]